MRITKVFAKNFRTLEDIEVSFKSNYCTLSGQNNAGKSAIVDIILHFMQRDDGFYYEDRSLSFAKDRTQWIQEKSFKIGLEIELSKSSDSGLLFLLSKFSTEPLNAEVLTLRVEKEFLSTGPGSTKCSVDGATFESESTAQILTNLCAGSNLVVHNSTKLTNRYIYAQGMMELLDVHVSEQHKEKITTAEAGLQRALERAAKHNTEALSELLGKLQDKYRVELSLPSRDFSRLPASVMLTNKSVKVPLSSWGSGTQNRTRILMSLLEASRIRGSDKDDRSTPVFVVEEPESFLHPSAQAEFGTILEEIAEELQLQIIATTHSPYMLNQRLPEANILLNRRIVRSVPRAAIIEETSGRNWMKPFADNLGIVPSEFDHWKSVITTSHPKVILIEGEIDKAYFEHIRKSYPDICGLPADIEFVAYGGKDALKNTQMMKFILGRFAFCFITYDLDAEAEVVTFLQRIGLEKDKNFCAVGRPGDTNKCIEGLLPDSVIKAVYARETDLVNKAMSADSSLRKSAKNALKTKFLDEFCTTKCDPKEMAGFKQLFTQIRRALNSSGGT